MTKLIVFSFFISLGLVAGGGDGSESSNPGSSTPVKQNKKVTGGDSDSDFESPQDESGSSSDDEQPVIEVTPDSHAAESRERLAERQVYVLYEGDQTNAGNQIYMITLGGINFNQVPIIDLRGRYLEPGELNGVVSRILQALTAVPNAYFYIGRTIVGVNQRVRGHNDGLRNNPERRLYHAIHANGRGAQMHMLVRGVHGEQLADLEHRFIIALGGLHGLGLNSNAGGNPRFARTGAPAQLGASPSTERAGAGQRIRVDLQLQRVADRVDDDAGLPTAWQNSIYAIAPEGANADFLRMPIIDLGGDYLNEVQLAALAGNLQQYFSNALFERYVGMAGAGHTERRLLLDRLDEHRHAVAENPHRRLPFAIQRWNAEGHTGVMHALIVNAHPEQLRDLEAITMRAANTMGPLGVNGLSPSRRLFGGTLANPPQEQRVAQGVAELARRGMAAVLSQMRAVAEFPRVAGVLQVANHGFGGSSF